MSIKIKRNDAGNCITFEGTTNPVYFNACLRGEVDIVDSSLVNVVNDITSAGSGETKYEFYNIPFTEFVDADGGAFANAAEVVAYLAVEGDVTIAQGLKYKGIWDAGTNTPDITTDTSGYVSGDFFNIITDGTHDFGSGDVSFINGDEVIFDGTNWVKKPYAGALIEYDSTSMLLNTQASVFADGQPGLPDPDGAEQGWYYTNVNSGEKINWYFLDNNNAGTEITKATLKNGWARIKFIQEEYIYIQMYTTPLGDGFDRFWFRSRYSYIGDTSGLAANTEALIYWGEEPSVHPTLPRVHLTLDSLSTLVSTHPDVSNDAVMTMALHSDSNSAAGEVEIIAKELGYKNGQYNTKYLLEATLDADVAPSGPTDLTDTAVDFKLDATSTTIMLDNGDNYGVNTIQAVANADGTIHINSMQGGVELYKFLDHTNVTLDGGTAIAGGLQDVVNTLNELFTVGAFQSVVISDPYSTLVADVAGVTVTGTLVGTAINPGGPDVGAGTVTSYNAGGLLTTETIDQAGEYFTFDIRQEGIMGFGLILNDVADVNGNATYGDPTGFCNGPNSGHYGYQFSHWFHPSPNGPWTNYGANTSYSQREGWSNVSHRFMSSPEGADWLAGNPVKLKVGLDHNSFIEIAYYDTSESAWIPIVRTTYPTVEGVEFHLGIKFGDSLARLHTVPKVHLLEPSAPTMYFRYVESPDGVYTYPLFATQEEAEYYDQNHDGTTGSGTYTTLMYPDDPTNTLWYKATTGVVDDASAAPSSATFESNPVTYTEITTLTNADLAPSAFADTTVTVNELSSVNIQTQPADTAYTTTFSGLTGSLIADGFGGITGTAPEVTGDNVANPSDTLTITVTRINSYGSSTGTLTLVVTNLTAPVITPITGFTHVAGSTALIDSSTMDDGSVVDMDENLQNFERFIILSSYVETNILPSILQTGGSYYIGVLNSGADVSSVTDADWDFAFVWEYLSSTTHRYKVIKDGVQQHAVGIGSNTASLFDYAIELHGDHAHMIACNANAINTEPSPAFGGTFTNATEVDRGESVPVTISFAYTGLDNATISTTGLSEIVTPAPDGWIQVDAPTSHTLNFDGSATMPTLQAGYTYRFLVGDEEYADLSTATGLASTDVLRFTADGSTEYTTGITRVGTPADDGFGVVTAYVVFSVPTDVPPLQWYTDANTIGSANTVTTTGSTYTVSITGITLEGPAANQTGTNITDNGDYGWASVDETVGAGQRFVMNNAFFTDLLAEMGDQYEIRIGLKGDNWDNTDQSTGSNSVVSGEVFKGDIQLRINKTSSNNIYLQLFKPGATYSPMLINTVALHEDTCGFIEITPDGNNIKMAFGRNGQHSIAEGDESTKEYSSWGAYSASTGDQGYGITSLDVVFLVTDIFNEAGADYDGANVDWTNLSEVAIPTPPVTNTTDWDKAVDFSGGSEHLAQSGTGAGVTPLKMGGVSTTCAAPASAGNTSNDGQARPWATAVLFQHEGHNSNQHIWNCGEGASGGDDNIYLRLSSIGDLYFGWGRVSATHNEILIASSLTANEWYGVYIGHNGTRWSGSNATAINLAAAFDIRVMSSSDSFNAVGSNLSTSSNWGSTGSRMDRELAGNLTIGGRGANRNFHGKVASMVSTSLNRNVAMPTDAEIALMLTDPEKWLVDYKVGQTYRQASTYFTNTFAMGDNFSSYATQVWLMGDGTLDSYSNGIRNRVASSWNSNNKLTFMSMVSNDIENVTIPGLS